MPENEPQAPSQWVERYAHLIPPGGRVLDVACGNGRHSRFLLGRGHQVTAVDRDLAGVADLASRLTAVHADLEQPPGWPFGDRTFDAVVVANYLHRPLLPSLVAAVAAGGVLIYETFAEGNARFGRPSRPDFLLQPGELLATVEGRLTVAAYQHGIVTPRPAVVQRICAVRGHTPQPLKPEPEL